MHRVATVTRIHARFGYAANSGKARQGYPSPLQGPTRTSSPGPVNLAKVACCKLNRDGGIQEGDLYYNEVSYSTRITKRQPL